MEQLRAEHAKLLANHPFAKRMRLSKNERKALNLPPDAYYEQEYLMEMNPRTGRTEVEKLLKLQEELNNNPTSRDVPGVVNAWEERGPRNVPGRTRAIMYDPNDPDHKRIFAGGVSGGLWKWDDVTSGSSLWDRIGIPENLAVSSITYDVNNPQNMFVGTGESYVGGVGNGIWRSTDGGTTWEHVYGGSTGETYYSSNSTLEVLSPGNIAGEYPGNKALFGPDTFDPITANLALVNDGTDSPELGCNTLTNAGEINGKIAVVVRGDCYFVEKVLNAQNAGALAVVVVNNVAGPPIGMADYNGMGNSITIPSLMISQSDGEIILNAMSSGPVNATFSFADPNALSGVIVPGTYFVNDIKTWNHDGNTEIFAAISDGYSDGAVVGGGGYGLVKSVDNGETWTQVTLPALANGHPCMPNDIEIGADNKIWVATTNSDSYSDGGGRIYASSDGVNFELKYSVQGGGKRTEIAVSATNPDKIYVLTDHNAVPVVIFKTENGFATNPTSLTLPNDADYNIPANDFTRGQSWYDLMIAVDPSDDDIVYVGGVDAFRSSDGGSTWQQMTKWTSYNGQPNNIPYVHADQHELVFNPVNPDEGVMVTDGGVFYASSFSSAIGSPSAINLRKWDYNTTQFYNAAIGQDVTNEILMAGAQDNGTYSKSHAAPGTNIFSSIQGGDGMQCFIDKDGQYSIASFPYNNFNRYGVSGGYQASLIAENNGFFNNPVDLDDNLDILYSNASTDSENRISRILDVGGSHPKSYLTNDLLLGQPTAFKVSPYTTSSSTLFVGTNRGNLFRLQHAEGTPVWTKITGDDFYGSISAINFGANENEIMVTFHNYGVQSIWFTNDGGLTWQNKEGDFPDIPVKAIMMNPLLNNEVIIGTNLGVWYTTNFNDANPHWMQAQNGMQNVKVTGFDLRTSDNKVVAATYGRGLFTGYFSQFPAGMPEENQDDSGVKAFPSFVTNGTLHVQSGKNLGLTEIRIFDIQGKAVFAESVVLNQNTQNIPINLSEGIYFVNINAKNTSFSQKIIVE